LTTKPTALVSPTFNSAVTTGFFADPSYTTGYGTGTAMTLAADGLVGHKGFTATYSNTTMPVAIAAAGAATMNPAPMFFKAWWGFNGGYVAGT